MPYAPPRPRGSSTHGRHHTLAPTHSERITLPAPYDERIVLADLHETRQR
jgi:hypothetical protein